MTYISVRAKQPPQKRAKPPRGDIGLDFGLLVTNKDVNSFVVRYCVNKVRHIDGRHPIIARVDLRTIAEALRVAVTTFGVWLLKAIVVEQRTENQWRQQ